MRKTFRVIFTSRINTLLYVAKILNFLPLRIYYERDAREVK